MLPWSTTNAVTAIAKAVMLKRLLVVNVMVFSGGWLLVVWDPMTEL
jgi:hypothetical protein